MTTTTIRFSNSSDKPYYIQVDPWAAVYLLAAGDEIEIVAESDGDSPAFHVDECRDTRILTILYSAEYFIVQHGKRIHWTEYQS
ncbi:MAG: hypothetical protein ACREHD_06600, partial [Pirellulales bacterium]